MSFMENLSRKSPVYSREVTDTYIFRYLKPVLRSMNSNESSFEIYDLGGLLLMALLPIYRQQTLGLNAYIIL